MAKKKKSSKEATSARTYDRTDKEAEASALGAPTRGFEEDDEYSDIRDVGMSFEGDTLSPDPDTDFEMSPHEAPSIGLDEQAPASEDAVEEEDLPLGGSQDLRYGQEDVSGVSEWSLRARQPGFEDGLDAGDFHRSDEEIREQVIDDLERELHSKITVEVRAAEVTLRGSVSDKRRRDRAEKLALSVPGTKTVHNEMTVSRSK